MKKIILLQFIFVCIAGFISGQATYYHTVNIQTQPAALNKALVSYPGFLMFCSGGGAFEAMYADSNSLPQWAKTYGPGSANDAIVDDRGHIVAVGSIGGFAVMNLLQNGGGIYWQYHFVDSGNVNLATSVAQLTDGTYIVEGVDGDSVIFIRLSSGGNPLFIISPQLNISPGKLLATGDGGFVSVNANVPAIPDSLNFIISRFDSSGNLLWAKQYACHDSISVTAFSPAAGNGFILAGILYDTTDAQGTKGFLLARFDSSGYVLWTNCYFDTLPDSVVTLNSVVQTSDRGFLGCGTLYTDTSGSNIMSFKVDSNGHFLWARNYVAIDSNVGCAAAVYNNGYVFFGTSYGSSGVDTNGVVIIRTDSAAQSGCVTDTLHFSMVPITLKDTPISYFDTSLISSGSFQYPINAIGAKLISSCPPVPPPPVVPYSHYYPMLDSVNIWHYIGDEYVVLPSPQTNNAKSLKNGCGYPWEIVQMEYTDGDTLVDSILYKQLWNPFYGQSCIEGFIREDTSLRRVYFKDILGSPEITVYDFSMHIGDSIYINLYHQNNWGGDFFDSGWYRLDSVVNINILSGQRRQFYLNYISNSGGGWHEPLIWLESVGNLCEFVYPYFINTGGARSFYNCNSGGDIPGGGVQYSCVQFLSCFSHENLVYFDSCAYHAALISDCNSRPDSCNYNGCGAVNEIPDLSSFTIYPNPATDLITLGLDVSQSSIFDIAILDMQGRQALPPVYIGRLDGGLQTRVIDISGLASGFYLVACKNAEGAIYRKLVVAR